MIKIHEIYIYIYNQPSQHSLSVRQLPFTGIPKQYTPCLRTLGGILGISFHSFGSLVFRWLLLPLGWVIFINK